MPPQLGRGPSAFIPAEEVRRASLPASTGGASHMGEGDAALLGWGLLVVVPGLGRGGIWDGASLLAQPLLRCVALGSAVHYALLPPQSWGSLQPYRSTGCRHTDGSSSGRDRAVLSSPCRRGVVSVGSSPLHKQPGAEQAVWGCHGVPRTRLTPWGWGVRRWERPEVSFQGGRRAAGRSLWGEQP